MSTDQGSRTSSRWLALLALPVLCCLGHAVLLGLGVGSLAAVTGAVTGSILLSLAGVVLAAVAVSVSVSVVLRRRGRR